MKFVIGGVGYINGMSLDIKYDNIISIKKCNLSDNYLIHHKNDGVNENHTWLDSLSKELLMLNSLNIYSINIKKKFVRVCLNSNKQRMIEFPIRNVVSVNLDIIRFISERTKLIKFKDELNKLETIINSVETINDLDSIIDILNFSRIKCFIGINYFEKLGLRIEKRYRIDCTRKDIGRLTNILLKCGYLVYDKNRSVAPNHNESARFKRHYIFLNKVTK